MARASLRDSILEAGLKVMVRQGYGRAGVRDIVAEAPAPQGSFTNHFRSKEEFAREVLDLYFARLKRLVAEALDDGGLTPGSGSGAISTSSPAASPATSSAAAA
jgi:TetR/AcrR family transcriptional repressor of nem operon